ncbi:hypothetical protein [Spiribacter vilamensis]|uniref:hypothetical protein n=1 Tax=Spiribacter vilamensis TaxID=531306 RepID=UPI00102B620D|nr:hypothetical protein [Spiribacter vilamensis]TVO60100.1 hypothetical protein FPL09_09710 [Spiribacter vilamensis]
MSGLATGLLAISATAIGNDCADELRTLPLPADAAEVYRDGQVVFGGRKMCQLAYKTEESIDMLTSRYEEHWEHKAGDLFRHGTGDNGDAILTQSGGPRERYMEIQRDGSGHAVMVNIIANPGADVTSVKPYIPLPDSFEVFTQQRNRDGFTVIAHTSLASEPAIERVVERLESAGWRVDDNGPSQLLGYRFAAMSRGTDTLDLAVAGNEEGAQATIHGVVPVSTDE